VMMDDRLRVLPLVLAFCSQPSVVEALTETEAIGWARWATVGGGLAASAHAQVGAGTASQWPPYMEQAWWTGAAVLEAVDDELLNEPDGSIDISVHPCFWGLADECEVTNAIEQPPELSQQQHFGDTMSLQHPLPCMTTEDCPLEQGAGIADDAPMLRSPAETESVTQHSCFWDEGCTAFA